MDGDTVGDDHHVVKYLSPLRWKQGIDPDWSAVLPRADEDGKASCNWMEYYDSGSDEERMVLIRKGILECRNPLQLKPKGAFVKINVGNARARLQQESRDARFVHRPVETNVSHSEMEGLSHGDDVAGAILGGCVIAPFPGVL